MLKHMLKMINKLEERLLILKINIVSLVATTATSKTEP